MEASVRKPFEQVVFLHYLHEANSFYSRVSRFLFKIEKDFEYSPPKRDVSEKFTKLTKDFQKIVDHIKDAWRVGYTKGILQKHLHDSRVKLLRISIHLANLEECISHVNKQVLSNFQLIITQTEALITLIDLTNSFLDNRKQVVSVTALTRRVLTLCEVLYGNGIKGIVFTEEEPELRARITASRLGFALFNFFGVAIGDMVNTTKSTVTIQRLTDRIVICYSANFKATARKIAIANPTFLQYLQIDLSKTGISLFTDIQGAKVKVEFII
jgi:hypothetical protein